MGKASKIVAALGLVLIALAGVLCIGGCESTITSPISGQKVTASALVAEEAAADREAAAKAAAAKASAAAAVKAAKLAAEKEAAAIGTQADLAAAEAARQLRLVELTLGAKVDEATSGYAAVVEEIEAAARFRNDTVGDALEQIAAKESVMSGVLGTVLENPLVKTGLAGVGVDGSALSPLVALLFGGGAMSVMNRRAKKREDEAWDEAQKAKDTEVVARDKAWDEAKREASEEKLRAEITAMRELLMKVNGGAGGVSASRIGPQG